MMCTASHVLTLLFALSLLSCNATKKYYVKKIQIKYEKTSSDGKQALVLYWGLDPKEQILYANDKENTQRLLKTERFAGLLGGNTKIFADDTNNPHPLLTERLELEGVEMSKLNENMNGYLGA